MSTKEGRALYGDLDDVHVILDADLSDTTPENDVRVIWWNPDQPTGTLIERATFRGKDPDNRMQIRSAGLTAGQALDAILQIWHDGHFAYDGEVSQAVVRLQAVWCDPRFRQAAYGGREA